MHAGPPTVASHGCIFSTAAHRSSAPTALARGGRSPRCDAAPPQRQRSFPSRAAVHRTCVWHGHYAELRIMPIISSVVLCGVATVDLRRDAVWRGPWRHIRTANPICGGRRISQHGHLIGRAATPRVPAEGENYLARVACRSQHQRVERRAVPEPDQMLPPVLHRARSMGG